MSLRSLHIVFITASTLLCCIFGVWASQQSNPLLAGGAFVAALVLAAYGIWFFRKIRSEEEDRRRRRKLIKPLAVMLTLWVFSARAASACSVCYGEADGPMIDAARFGVYLMFGLVLAVQVAFVIFFWTLRKRAKAYQPSPSRLG